jgi:hypothetical protein
MYRPTYGSKFKHHEPYIAFALGDIVGFERPEA